MEASDWWLRLAVSPMRMTFATQSRHILRYEGAIPPRDSDMGSLNARVDDTFTTASFR